MHEKQINLLAYLKPTFLLYTKASTIFHVMKHQHTPSDMYLQNLSNSNSIPQLHSIIQTN